MKRAPLFFVLIILGVLLVIIGIGLGASSHSSTYKQVSQDTIKHYISDGTTGYLQMASSPDLYVVNEGDFSPVINGTQTLQDNDIISFVADPTSTSDIDSQSTIGTHLVGTGEKVVEITLVGNSSGQTMEFTTAAYKANAQGYTQNNWGGAVAMIVIGLLLAIASFFLPRRNPQPSFAIAPGMPMGQPMPNPYQQPYQGVPPYPGSAPYNQQQPPNPQYPQYPSSPYPQQPMQPPTAYGQPANPYGQPQQPGQYPPPPGYDPSQRANPYE